MLNKCNVVCKGTIRTIRGPRIKDIINIGSHSTMFKVISTVVLYEYIKRFNKVRPCFFLPPTSI